MDLARRGCETAALLARCRLRADRHRFGSGIILRQTHRGPSRWSPVADFFVGTLLSGIVWGAGSVLLAGQDLIHQFFFGLLLAGLAAGGVSTLSSYRGVYAAFLLPGMTPLAVRMALYLDPVHVAMASMMLLFVALMLGISARIHATIAESLRLRFRNLDLVDTLSATKDNLEEVNTALRREIGEHRKAQEILMKSEQKLRLHASAPACLHEWTCRFASSVEPCGQRIFGYAGRSAGRHPLPDCRRAQLRHVATLWKRLPSTTTAPRDEKIAPRATNSSANGLTPAGDAQGACCRMTCADGLPTRAQERLTTSYHYDLTTCPIARCITTAFRCDDEARRQGAVSCAAATSTISYGQRTVGMTRRRVCSTRQALSLRARERYGGAYRRRMNSVWAGRPGRSRERYRRAEDLRRSLRRFRRRRDVRGPSSQHIFPSTAHSGGLVRTRIRGWMYQPSARGTTARLFRRTDGPCAAQRPCHGTSLRRALERREFLCITTNFTRKPANDRRGSVILWQHPEFGMCRAGYRHCRVKRTDPPIGEWGLREACQPLSAGTMKVGACQVAVNLSTQQFRHGRLKETLAGVLAETGFDPRYLSSR